MYFKLYRNKFREPPPKERRELFRRIYEDLGVELIGVWKNIEDELEYFMMTKFKDKAHYLSFIKSVQERPDYIEMTERISEVRLSNESYTLTSA